MKTTSGRRRLLVGTALAVLIFVEVLGSVGAYLQRYNYTHGVTSYTGDPALLTCKARFPEKF